MNKMVPLHRYLISLVCIAIISGGIVYKVTQPKIQVEPSTYENDELSKIHELYETIQNQYYKDVDKKALIEGALKGMTEALDDPYTTYMDQESASEFSSTLSDNFEGIGAVLSIKDEYPIIAETPIKESPAEKAGLKMDDRILKVDGKSVKGQALTEVVSKIRGKKGTKVKLTIQRGEETFEISIVRDKIPIASVTGELVKKDATVGKIQIITFSENTASEFEDEIRELRKKGAKKWIIDVRQNPGGYLDQVERIASMFLKNGQTIVQFSTNDQKVGETVASEILDNGFKITEPTVLLIDGSSASASEILAAALNENLKTPLIGSTTFGKGTVQMMDAFDDQSELKLTVQKWLTPKGNWIHEQGIRPTYVTEFPDYAYLTPLSQDQIYQKGEKSKEIYRLNQFLAALGYSTKGMSFTYQTEKAVKNLQEKSGLPVTGIVDKKTIQVLQKTIIEQLQKNDPAEIKALEVLSK